MTSILIADDHKLIRETWSFILSRDTRFSVIGCCSNAEEAVVTCGEKNPDVVLMDINMTPFSGLEATRRIRTNSPNTRVIAITMHAQAGYARKMLEMGASGYVTKNSSREEMINAIVEVAKGNVFVCDEIKEAFSEDTREDSDCAPACQLTDRELAIVNLIRLGSSSKDISSELKISIKTVEVHRHNILKKLKLKNAASLIHFMNTRYVSL
jgi:DNA-binding NarL/FixJ family response regulator